nr:MFS transporter [uncultured Roseococcus sp.]
MTAPAAGSWRPVALIVGALFFMEQLDTTILATALPVMAADLGTDPLRMNLALTAYLLTLTGFIPLSGALADRFGSRRIMTGAVLLFTGASLMCAWAPNLATLVVARALQGVGGAMMVPVGRLALLRAAPPSEFVRAMSWVLIPAMLGPMLGPPLGGLIVSWFSWHWIFYINVPLGLAGALFIRRHVAQHRTEQPRPLDLAGALLCGLALACFVLGLEGLSAGHGPRALAWSLLGAAVVAALIYAWHARRHPAPVLDFRLMRIPTFGIAVVGGTLFRTGFGALPFLLPMLLQLGFGYSPAQSGAMTFVAAVGGLVMKAISTRLLRRFGFRDTLVWNGALCGLFLVACAGLSPAWPVALTGLLLLVGGLARSLQFNAYGTMCYVDVPGPRMSAATSFHDTFQQLSLTLGISLGALAVSGSMWLQEREAPALSDFSLAFLLVGAIALAAVPVCHRLAPGAGTRFSGAAPR